METVSRKFRWIIRLIIPAIVIASAAILYGHGGEEHNDTAAAETTMADSAVVSPDSINAIINIGFTQLEPLFKRACFDCHTNKTDFPWYYKIPGIRQMIDNDIKHARKHIDMSNGFPFTGHASQVENLRAIREEIKEDAMPPFDYRLMHWSASPSKEEAEAIINWADSSMELLSPGASAEPPEQHEIDTDH